MDNLFCAGAISLILWIYCLLWHQEWLCECFWQCRQLSMYGGFQHMLIKCRISPAAFLHSKRLLILHNQQIWSDIMLNLCVQLIHVTLMIDILLLALFWPPPTPEGNTVCVLTSVYFKKRCNNSQRWSKLQSHVITTNNLFYIWADKLR